MLSKQGEPLVVEFDLESLSPEEQQGLEVNLADRGSYSALGASFDGVLNSAKAVLAKRLNGQPYVSVTSKEPVSQSFLDVLLQLHWSTGQVTNEMGLLLDSATMDSTDNLSAPSQVPVHAGDTASELALRYKDASVSLDQMLMGLLRSNPNAFVAQNVNRLRADANLTLPTKDEALNLKPKDASEQVKLQHIDYEQYRAALVAKLQNAKPGLEKNTKQTASGLVGSKAKTPREKKDQLKLSEANTAAAKAADELAQQAQAKIDAQKAQELSQNINDLNAIAKNAATPWSLQKTLLDVGTALSKAWTVPKAWLSVNAPLLAHWLDHPLAPVWAGLSLVILVLGALWRQKTPSSTQADAPAHDMDHQPWLDPESMTHDAPPAWAQVPVAARHEPRSFDAPAPQHDSTKDMLSTSHAEHDSMGEPTLTASSPTTLSDHVDLNFDLDLPLHDESLASPFPSHPNEPLENPLQVRFELAQELWQVGQQHTARAIVQEIAQQATGELLSSAHAWLAERG